MVGVHQIRLAEQPLTDTGLSRFFLGVYRFLLVFAGVGLLLLGFCQALGLTVEPSLYLLLFPASAYAVFALSWKRLAPLLLLPGAVLCFFYFFTQWKHVQDGIFHLENAVIAKFNRYYEAELIEFVTHYPEKVSLTALLSLVAVILVLLLAVSVTCCRLRGCWLIGVLLYLGLTVWVNAFPETVTFLLITVHCFLVLLSGSVERLSSGERARLLGFCLAALAGIMGLCRLICNETVYEEALQDSEVRLELQSAIREMDVEKLMEDIGAKIDRMMSSEGGLGIGETRSNAGMAGGDLGQSTNGIRFTEKTHLKVTLPKESGAVYLRGYIGARYTGSRWLEVSPEQQKLFLQSVDTGLGDSYNFTARLIQAFFTYGQTAGVPAVSPGYRLQERYASMNIEVVGANPKYYYAPYDTYEYTGATGKTDGCLQPNGKSSYRVGYFYNKEQKPFYYAFSDSNICNLSSLDDAFFEQYEVKMALMGYMGELQEKLERYNADYRSYAESVYLEIPAECSAVKEILESTGSVAGDVEMVCSFLKENYQYTLSPQPMERGEDYIEHFLYESKEGYCMHFASAATMLFRSLGIPARYVEGYVVRPVDIQKGKNVDEGEITTLNLDGTVTATTVPYLEVEVPDSAAHAWVEIYLDNYGWFPVEVTSGYRMSTNFSAMPTWTPEVSTPTPVPTLPDGTTPTPVPTLPDGTTPTPRLTGKLSPAVKPSASPSPDVTLTPSPDGDGGNRGSGGKVLGILLRVFGVFALAVLALSIAFACLGRWRRARRNLLKSPDSKRRMLAYYREILRILGMCGLRPEGRENDAEFCLRAEEELSAGLSEEDADAPASSLQEVCRIAQKARFSRNGPEKEESTYVVQYYRRLRTDVRRKSKGLRALRFRLTVV